MDTTWMKGAVVEGRGWIANRLRWKMKSTKVLYWYGDLYEQGFLALIDAVNSRRVEKI